MSIKVTIHNYMFPIHFRYKGWRVKLEKKIDLFKDVKVEATFTPPHIDFDYWNIIVPDKVEQILKKRGTYRQADYEKYLLYTKRYISSFTNTQQTKSCGFSANGGLLDRFLGQNISATDKVINKVTEWMDINLPTVQEPDDNKYITYLMQNGVSNTITSIVKIAILSTMPYMS